MRIGELAKRVGISADWLRRQERTGNIPAGQRDRDGHRRHDEDDVDRIRRIVFDGSNRRRTERLEGSEGRYTYKQARVLLRKPAGQGAPIGDPAVAALTRGRLEAVRLVRDKASSTLRQRRETSDRRKLG